MSDRPVRVRFAPSPTGALHIGGLRTALYNYLLAKQSGGQFLIRIEDTDQTRYVDFAEDYIMEALAWIGITPDEGVREGGPHAPYRQSERKAMYRQYAEQLVADGHAYYAFDTPEELNEMRARLEAAKVVSPQYNAITRMTMKNSLTLPEDEVKARLASGDAYVIRLKIPRKEEVRLNDLIRGWVVVNTHTLDDKVLMKSDGMPTYHLANVVDDHLMQITHVIRGEEWLPSAPTHVLLYRFLGWEATMPRFAHLPLLLKPDGNGKLSKRDGENGGYPVFPLQWTEPESKRTVIGFRQEGYLPEAMVNFLAFLGWNPGGTEEMYTMDQLISAFSIERVGQSGTKFDINKAKWFNRQYLLKKSDEELGQLLTQEAQRFGKSLSAERATAIAALVKERCTFAKELYTEGLCLIEMPAEYDAQVVASKWNDDVKQVLYSFQNSLSSLTQLTADEAKHLIHEAVEGAGLKPGKVMQGIRLALTGAGAGPDLMQSIALLGPEEVKSRIERAFAQLG